MTTEAQEQYWLDALASALESADCLDKKWEQMTDAERGCIAMDLQASHENYGMAFYQPPASDRLDDIRQEWQGKLKELQAEFDAFRDNAHAAVRKSLGQRADAIITIGEYGEVLRHDGRTTQIQ